MPSENTGGTEQTDEDEMYDLSRKEVWELAFDLAKALEHAMDPERELSQWDQMKYNMLLMKTRDNIMFDAIADAKKEQDDAE